MTLSGDQYGTTIDNANFQLYGNLYSIGAYKIFGTATYSLKGNASGQTISQTNSSSNITNLTIDTGSYDVTIATPVQLTKNFTVVSYGNININNHRFTFFGECGVTSTIVPSSLVLKDVTFVTTCSTHNFIGSMNVSGNLHFEVGNHVGLINGSAIYVGGNITLNSASSYFRGSTVLVLNGSADQTVDLKTKGELSIQYSPTSSSNTLTFDSGYYDRNTGHSFTVNSGSVNMNANSVDIKSLALNGNTLTKNGGVLTVNSAVAGTGSLFGGTVAP